MKRPLIIIVLAIAAGTALALAPETQAGGCGRYCPVPVYRHYAPVVHQKVVTNYVDRVFEVVYPVNAVSFQYFPPPPAQVQPTPIFPTAPMQAAPTQYQQQPGMPVQTTAAPEDDFPMVRTSDEVTIAPSHGTAYASTSLYAGAGTSGIFSLFENRCASCHDASARGGVRLWNEARQFAPTKDGQPLSRGKIWDAVARKRTMPKGSPLTEQEIEVVNNWIAE